MIQKDRSLQQSHSQGFKPWCTGRSSSLGNKRMLASEGMWANTGNRLRKRKKL